MVIFVGGIHGSGKGTICVQLAKSINYTHFTASELLKWNEVSHDKNNKYVQDISDTQEKLIKGLEEVKKSHSKIILDGHYCLFNSKGIPERVPISTFEKIDPKVICVVYADPRDILARLQERDGKIYDLAVIQGMQQLELDYAQELAEYFGRRIKKINSENLNLEELIAELK